MANQLPPGFQLDQQSNQPTGLPSGFVLDKPEQESFVDDVLGGVETAAAIGTGLIAEPISGLMGLAAAINPFNPEGTAARRVEETREALTYQPRTKSGQHALKQIGETLQPVGEFFENLERNSAEFAFEKTGSPLAASLASTLPTAITELLGFAGGKAATSAPKLQSDIQQATRRAIGDIRVQEVQTGIRQLTSDVFPPESRVGKFFQQQGELIAPSQRVTQQTQRIKAIEDLLNDYDVTDGARFEGQIVKGVRDSVDEFKSKAGILFDESVGQLDALGEFDIPSTKRFAQSVIDRELKKGTLKDAGLIESMEGILAAPEMSFETLKSVRSSVGKKISDIQKGAPVQGNTDLGLQKGLYSKMTRDMEKFAESANPDLFKQWKEADKVFSDFAVSGNKTSAKRLIKDGGATPEIVDQLLFSNKNSDLEFLANNLTTQGRQAAKQRILQMALVKSSPDGTEINPNRFRTQLNKMRNQIGKFFPEQEREAILALRDVLTDTARAQDSAVATATGQQLVPLFAITNPQVLIPGAAQAIIETPTIRNLLIKRKAAKTAKLRNQLDAEILQSMRQNGLIGAAATGAATQQENN